MFHHVHAFFIVFINYCMLGVWQKVQVTFFGCIELKWVLLLEFTLIELVSHALDVFNLLCSQILCLAHIVHTLGISRHTPCISCTHMHQHMHSYLFSCIVPIFSCFICLACCFEFICSVSRMIYLDLDYLEI